jgi:hypothetical protein
MNKKAIYLTMLISLLVFCFALTGCGDKKSGDPTNPGDNNDGTEENVELIGKWGKYSTFVAELKSDGSGVNYTMPINWSVSENILTFDYGYGSIGSAEWSLSNSKLYLSNGSGPMVGLVALSPLNKLD